MDGPDKTTTTAQFREFYGNNIIPMIRDTADHHRSRSKGKSTAKLEKQKSKTWWNIQMKVGGVERRDWVQNKFAKQSETPSTWFSLFFIKKNLLAIQQQQQQQQC